MFGRDKTSAAESASPAPVVTAKAGGKGRATPTRKEAEQRNKRPLVGAQAPVGATKAERKAARQARSAQVRQERAQARQAMMTGDERHLYPKDKGPVRRFVRDYVDARRNLGEYFLPIAIACLLVGILPVPIARLLSLLVLYAMVILIAIDSFLLRRRVQGLADAKFNEKGTAGVGTYAMMRALQFRRGRMPKPQVARGEFPAGSS